MTIYRQIYNKIIEEIRTGKLKPGQKILSIRKYADENGISCNSVQNAYNQLLEEGYIYSREKSGFYVADFEENLVHLELKDNSAFLENNQNTTNDKQTLTNTNLSRPPFSGNHIYSANPNVSGKLNLSANLTDSSLFPYDTLRRLYRKVLSTSNESILGQNGDFCGDLEFRKSIADYLYNHRGINCSPEQIIIGSGTASLMSQLIRLFKFSEKTTPVFIIENPCYEKTKRIIQDEGCNLISLPIDENGATVPELTQKTLTPYNLPATQNKGKSTTENDLHLEQPSSAFQNESQTTILLITPSHQFPLGITMPVTRRTALVNWANQDSNRYIIEDDYDSEFRYKGHPIPALQSMDTNGRVIYIGTFSRTLTPSMRINYAVLPQKLALLYKKRFNYYSCPVPRIEQQVLSLFINGGYFERHINRSKKIYKARRDLMISELEKNIPGCKLYGTQAGLHFIMQVKDEKTFIKKAAENNLILQGTGKGSVIIGYAHLKDEEIKLAAKKFVFLTNM